MLRKSFTIFILLLFLGLSVVPTGGAFAAAINTDVALPVRQGGFVFRSQARWLKADDLDVLTFPNVLVFGAAPKLSLFAISSLIYRNEEFNDFITGSRVENDDFGLGDTTLLARYTLFSKDYSTGTTRFALLGGVKIPTGDDDLEPITTDSFDVPLGIVATATEDGKKALTVIGYLHTHDDFPSALSVESYNVM
ncbi:MAG: transporter [Thermodesulfobacteriota bacterium]